MKTITAIESRKLFRTLTEDQKINLLENVAGFTSPYQALDQSATTDYQDVKMAEHHLRSVKWELGQLMERVEYHVKTFEALGYDNNGTEYSAFVETDSQDEIQDCYEVEVKQSTLTNK